MFGGEGYSDDLLLLAPLDDFAVSLKMSLTVAVDSDDGRVSRVSRTPASTRRSETVAE